MFLCLCVMKDSVFFLCGIAKPAVPLAHPSDLASATRYETVLSRHSFRSLHCCFISLSPPTFSHMVQTPTRHPPPHTAPQPHSPLPLHTGFTGKTRGKCKNQSKVAHSQSRGGVGLKLWVGRGAEWATVRKQEERAVRRKGFRGSERRDIG